MNKDILIMVIMIIMMMTYSAFGSASENTISEKLIIELDSESRRLNFQNEIARQEGQFRVVVNAIKEEGAGESQEMELDGHPVTVTLIKTK